MKTVTAPESPKPPAADSTSRQKNRSIAIAAGLVFLVILFYLITIFKLGSAVLNKGM